MRFVVGLASVLVFWSCGGSVSQPQCVAGTESCRCLDGGRCHDGLTCVSGVCVSTSGPGDSGPGDSRGGDADPGDHPAGDNHPGDAGAGDSPGDPDSGDADPGDGSSNPECGNGIAEDGEQCDGKDHRAKDCVSSGFLGGTLGCVNCSLDFSACHTDPSVCGDLMITGFERCDGDTRPCADFGLGAGTITCTTGCYWSFSACQTPDYCSVTGRYSNGICDPCEAWSGSPDPDCQSHCGADGVCAEIWSIADAAFSCTAAGLGRDPDCTSCGDGEITGLDMCDSPDHGGWQCDDFGLVGTGYDCTSACTHDLRACEVPPFAAESTTPADGASGVPLETTLTVSFNKAVDPASVTSTQFVLVGDGIGVIPSTVSASGRSATLIPESLAHDTAYVASLAREVRDTAGNTLPADVSWSFTTEGDSTPPQVVDHWPVDGQSGVEPDVAVRLFFNEPLDATTVNGSTISLSNRTASVAYDGTLNAAVVTPDTPYEHLDEVTVTIGTGVADLAGNPLAAEYSFGFIITPDVTPPAVIGRDPAPDATGVAWDVTPTISFSEPLDPMTVSTSSVLLRSGSTVLPASVTYDDTTRTVTVTPAGLLRDLATHQITVASSVTDVAGNSAVELSWWFTTVVETDPPIVVATMPEGGAVGVPVSQDITMTFDDDLDPATVGPSSFLIGTCIQWAIGPEGPYCYEYSWHIPTDPDYDPATRTVTMNNDAIGFNSTWFVRATTAVTDDRGNPMAAPHTFAFTTEPDPAGPSVVGVSPADGSRFASLWQPILVTFDKPVDPATVTSSSLYVDGHPTTVTYDPTRLRAELEPTAAFDPSTEYTLHATTDIADTDGDPLMAPVTVSFRTGASGHTVTVSAKPSRTSLSSAWTSTGEGVAAWSVGLGDSTRVYAAHYDNATWGDHWEPAEYRGRGGRPRLLSVGGSILLRWNRDGVEELSLRAPGGSWTGLARPGAEYRIVTDGNQLLAVGADAEGTWSRLLSGTTWQAAVRVSTETADDPRADGNAAGFVKAFNVPGLGIVAHVGDGSSWSQSTVVAESPDASLTLLRAIAGRDRYLVVYLSRSFAVTDTPYELRAVTFTSSAVDSPQLLHTSERQLDKSEVLAAASREADRFAVAWQDAFDREMAGAIFFGSTPLSYAVFSEANPGSQDQISELVSVGSEFALTHTYPVSGTYTIVYVSAGLFSWDPVRALEGRWDLHASGGSYLMTFYDGGSLQISLNGEPAEYLATAPRLSHQVAGRGSGFVVTYASADDLEVTMQQPGGRSWLGAGLANGAVPTSSRGVRLARIADEAVAVWQQYRQGTWDAYASHLIGDTWSTPERVATEVSCLDVAASGTSFALIYQSRDESPDAGVRRLSSGAGAWSAVSRLTGLYETFSGACAIASDGTGYVAAYTSRTSSSLPAQEAILHSSSLDGATWGVPVQWVDGGSSERRTGVRLASDGTDYYLAYVDDTVGGGTYAARWDGVSWVDHVEITTTQESYALVAGDVGALVAPTSWSLEGAVHDGDAWLATVRHSIGGHVDAAWNGSEYAVVVGSHGAAYTELQGDAWSDPVTVSSIGRAAIEAASSSVAVLSWNEPLPSRWGICGSAVLTGSPTPCRSILSAGSAGLEPGELHLLGGHSPSDFIAAGTAMDQATGAYLLWLWHGL